MKILKKLWEITKRVLKTTWFTLKAMNNWMGRITLILVWVVLSGAGTYILGWILRSKILRNISLLVMAFWAGPWTPLIPITIVVSVFIRSVIFRDPSVSVEMIMKEFKRTKGDIKDDGNKDIQ